MNALFSLARLTSAGLVALLAVAGPVFAGAAADEDTKHTKDTPAPVKQKLAEDKAVLLAQRGISEVLAMANGAELKVVGIGSVDADAQLV